MYALVALLCLAVPLGLLNGDFRQTANGQATGWQPFSHYSVVAGGGRNGLNAVELTCAGGDDSSGAQQTVKFDQPRSGPFVVSAWVRCDSVEAGGDCGIWVDTIQSDGSPIYASTATPRKDLTDWQRVSVEVWPQKPVREVQIYLLLRNVKGKIRFCDVQLKEIPLRIRDLRLAESGSSTCDVQGLMNDKVPWTLRATQNGAEIWRSSGEGKIAAGRFPISGAAPVTVRLSAARNGGTIASQATIRPNLHASDADLWSVGFHTQVFQDDLPPRCQDNPVTLHAARNDRESFQICLRPHEQRLTNTQVAVTDLTMAAGPGTPQPAPVISRSSIEWFRVGYLWVSHPTPHPYAERDTACWWPDALLPPAAFSVEPRTTQPLWFTVHVPADTVPGAYSGTVTLTADGMSPRQVPVSVKVYPAVIPDQGHIKTSFALMDCYLNQLYGSISPQLRRKYTDYLLAHHINPDNLSRTAFPDLDELMYANTRGLNAFNIAQAAPEGDDNSGWTFCAPVEAYAPAFQQHFMDRLTAIVPELEKRGLMDKAYIYGFDERGPDYDSAIKDLFGAIKARYPKLHTVSTRSYTSGIDPLALNIDCWVPLTTYYDPSLAKSVRARGGEMWWYICSSSEFPYANCWLENPLNEPRLVWWQAFQENVEGFLYWGLNIWRYTDSKVIPADSGPRLDWRPNLADENSEGLAYNGDGLLLYPGPDGPIGSLRMEAIRDGLEDFELLRQYKARHGASAVNEILQLVTTTRQTFSRDPRELWSARLRMLQGLGQ